MGPNRIPSSYSAVLKFSPPSADLDSMKRIAWFILAGAAAWAQGPTVSPMLVPTFTYTMNSGTIPAAQPVKVTLPASIGTLPVIVTNATAASVACGASASSCGWLQVTHDP